MGSIGEFGTNALGSIGEFGTNRLDIGDGDERNDGKGGEIQRSEATEIVDPDFWKLAEKQPGALQALPKGEDGIADDTLGDKDEELDDLFGTIRQMRRGRVLGGCRLLRRRVLRRGQVLDGCRLLRKW